MPTYYFIYLKYKNNCFIFLSKQSWTKDPITLTRQIMILADHMNIHSLIQNHVKFAI